MTVPELAMDPSDLAFTIRSKLELEELDVTPIPVWKKCNHKLAVNEVAIIKSTRPRRYSSVSRASFKGPSQVQLY